MRRFNVVVLFLAVFMSRPLAAAETDARELSSKITKVTVYSDRARVTRVAKVKLGDRPALFSVSKLPGWVDDGSVRVTLSPPDAGRIVDVRVQRNYLAKATDEEYRKAAAAVQEVSDEIASLDDELRVLDAQTQQLNAVKVFSMEKIARDAPLRVIKVEDYGKVVKFIADSLRETAKARRAVALRRRELTPELAVRQRRLYEVQSLTQLEETTILLTLSGRGGKPAAVELTYMLPGATWQPAHELRALGPNPQSSDVTSFAVVSQTSGEDWKGVELAFSTQSSTELIRIPELTALTLGDGQAAARLVQERTASFDRAKAAFEGQNRIWNKMNAPVAQQMEVYETNLDQLQMVQGQAAAVFQRLRKRGTSAHFAGDGRTTVRGDGHPVRVLIGEATLQAEQAIVAVPEQSLNAVRTLKMVNAGSQPLLPGDVALYHDGAFLGMTALDFVAEGETFSIFLGVADQVKLSRVLDRKHSSIRRKKRTRMKVRFIVEVENLSDEPVTLDLMDRVPVATHANIEVDDVEISGDKEPDSKGLLKWHLTLKPKKRRKFTIEYRLEYPPALVRELRRANLEMEKAMPAAKRARKFDVSEQIMDLEGSFD